MSMFLCSYVFFSQTMNIYYLVLRGGGSGGGFK